MSSWKEIGGGLWKWILRGPSCTLPLLVTVLCQQAVGIGMLGHAFRPGLIVELCFVAYLATLFVALQRHRAFAILLFSAASASLYALAVARSLVEPISVFDLASIEQALFVLPRPPGLVVELCLVAYLATLFVALQRHRTLAILLFSAASASLYALTVAKALILHEPISLFDLATIDEALFVLPRPLAAVLVVAAFAWIAATLANLRPSPRSFFVTGFPLLACAAFTASHPMETATVLNGLKPREAARRYLEVLRQGPWTSLLREFPEIAALSGPALSGAPPADPFDRQVVAGLFDAQSSPPPNLYLIQVESFVDPANFRDRTPSPDPMDPRLRRWLGETGGPAVSPTFGGLTAAAEFETLCGTPSLRRLGIEFNLLSGSIMPCLPALLSSVGYTTVVSVPAPSWFFNTRRAYASLGFEQANFLGSFRRNDFDGDWLSHETVFEQTKPRLEALLASRRPFFSHIVTAAGHVPFTMNPDRRPPRYVGGDWPATIANVTVYTSKAVADFIEWIEVHDPRAVIVAYGDHLPPLEPNGGEYGRAGYRVEPLPDSGDAPWPRRHELHATPLVLRRGGASIAVGPTPHHLLGAHLLDLLLDGAYCDVTPCPHESRVALRPYGDELAFTSPDSFPDDACPVGNLDPDCVAAREETDEMTARYWSLLREGSR